MISPSSLHGIADIVLRIVKWVDRNELMSIVLQNSFLILIHSLCTFPVHHTVVAYFRFSPVSFIGAFLALIRKLSHSSSSSHFGQ